MGAAGVLACLLYLAAPCRVARAQRPRGGAHELIETEMPLEGGIVSYVTYRKGRAYRRINVADLRGLAVGSTKLHGLPVCVEGKFDRPVSEKAFFLMGSERQFVVSDRSLMAGLMQGDNLWAAGTAQRVPREASCYMRVSVVVRMKDDFDLFEERFAKYVEADRWRKLLDLAAWIEENGKLLSGSRVDDFGGYRTLKTRALRRALRVHERTIPAGDADGLYELARMYVKLLGQAGRFKAVEFLRKAVSISPRHRKVIEMLGDMGLVRVRARWVFREEQETSRPEPVVVVATPNTNVTADPDVTRERQPRRALSTPERVRRMLEIEAEAAGPDGPSAVAELILEEDDAVARRIVWILANIGGTAGLKGLLVGQQSESAAVRKDVAEALAWSRRLDDLSRMIRSEDDAEVRSTAVSALGGVGTREGVDALMSLLLVDDEPIRARIGEELGRLTGQTIAEPSAWRSWWRANRDGFKVPANGDHR